MSGIIFLKTRKLDELQRFYIETIGCDLWLNQGGCMIFQHGNLLLGFCAAESAETSGIITFFYPSETEVDAMYDRLRTTADAPPRRNDRCRIYQFFSRDPENRVLEFQYFVHPVAGHLTGAELLMHRRSVREFLPDPVPEPLLMKLLDICRYSPTSMNSQSFQFRFVTDPDDLVFLGSLRGPASAPIARAPMAAVVMSDPSRTKRPEQDADIADLIWNVPEIVSILSEAVELKPGDLVYTGTPAGVGAIVAGDKVTGGIDGLGDIEITIAPPRG